MVTLGDPAQGRGRCVFSPPGHLDSLCAHESWAPSVWKPLWSPHALLGEAPCCAASLQDAGLRGAGVGRDTQKARPQPDPAVPQVLLCASSPTSSLVECWSLRKEGLPVNNVFQQIAPAGEWPGRPAPARPLTTPQWAFHPGPWGREQAEAELSTLACRGSGRWSWEAQCRGFGTGLGQEQAPVGRGRLSRTSWDLGPLGSPPSIPPGSHRCPHHPPGQPQVPGQPTLEGDVFPLALVGLAGVCLERAEQKPLRKPSWLLPVFRVAA